MRRTIANSVRLKLILVMMASTFAALAVAAVAMVVYDLRNYREAWVNDLTTQATILAHAAAPALAFDDHRTAYENLAMLKVRKRILAAALYTPSGMLFASYAQNDDPSVRFPATPERSGYSISGENLVLFHRVIENNEHLGTVYLRARYDFRERLRDYLGILGAVMIISLAVAAAIATWLQSAFATPILSVAAAARKVVERRDYSLRVQKTTNDEVGDLVDAFNGMLAEIGRRAQALEQSNRSLQHEMNERRNAEQALLAADRRKDEFLATLAHELRNPLAPLSNALQILRLADKDTDLAQKARDMMERQLKQMVRLVDDLLDVSRITMGKLTLQKEHVELHPILRDAVDTVRTLMASLDHELVQEVPDEPIYLDGDATRLAQVFSNLLNNAAKYTDPGRPIVLRVAREDNEVVVKVVDKGIGIAADMIPEIFEAFAQVDRSLERSHSGLGVGLALAKRLIELHGGVIEARSPGVGMGSEFIVRLPILTAAHGEAAQIREMDVGDGERAEGYRILLADDNVDFATSMAMLLQAVGHEVRVAHDGAEALAIAGDFHPQFAFLDIGLPQLNGYDLARRLRQLPATADTLLVAVTGWGQERDRQLAREAGFEHHLVKPVAFPQIEAILKSVTVHPHARRRM